MRVTVFTIGHGVRPIEELVETLTDVGVTTLVDVRRFPSSRRNPQFNQAAVADSVSAAGMVYVHEVDLGGRRPREPGGERFGCIPPGAVRGYAARRATPEWQAALERALGAPAPCFMCAEPVGGRCPRRLIAELLTARGHEVPHLLGPGRREPHRLWN